MEKKIALYICSGCGIGDALDIEQLGKVATDDHDTCPAWLHSAGCHRAAGRGSELEGEMMATPSIERDEWLYVWTDDEESARRFFHLPPGTLVRLEREENGRKCWAVKVPKRH